MHELQTIPAGRAGLAAKVRKIRELVETAKRKPEFRARAAAIVRGVPQKDHEGEIRAVFDFVRDRVRYLRDPWSPAGLELFTEPGRMLEDVDAGNAAGDCDDHVILASALLETIGYRTRYRIGGLPPDRYRHIWLEVEAPKLGWIPLELTGKDLPFGFDPSSRFPLTLTLYGDEMNAPSGLGRGWSASRSRIRYPRRVRQARLARGIAPHALEGDEPPSWWNAQVANASAPDWFGATPSDFLRAQAIREMAPETIFGQGMLGDYETDDQPAVGLGFLKKLSKKLSKATKKITASAKKVTKKVAKATKKGTLQPFVIGKKIAKSTRGVLKTAGKLVGSTFKKSSPGAPGGDSISPEAAEEIGPPEVYTDSEATSYEEGGYYNPEPAYDADGSGSDWTTYEEPFYEDAVPADSGSYVPTPDDWPPQETDDAFEEESYGGGDVAPGFGMWGSAGSVFDDEAQEVDPMENTFGSLGAESWLTEIGKQAANTVLQYQQARLSAQAAKKGYGPLSFGPPQQAPASRPPAPRSGSAGLGSWGPIALVGIGGIVILSLMGGVRRRR